MRGSNRQRSVTRGALSRRGRLSTLATLCGALVLIVGGCEKKKPTTPKPRNDEAARNEDPDKPKKDDGIVIKGLLGKIDVADVEKAFRAKAAEIQKCLDANVKSLRFVGGEMDFFFVIGTDGVPARVDIKKSTIGNYLAEQCLAAIAKSLRFVKPEGGKAHVNYSLPIQADSAVGETWGKEKVEKTIKPKLADIDKCKQDGKPGSYTLNFYIWPGGKVKSLGVSAEQALPDTFPKCVADILMPLTFPDPLGKVVKVSADF